MVLEDSVGNTIIQKRTSKGIWHNLYEFPLLETTEIADFNFVSKAAQDDFFSHYTINGIEERSDATLIHKLSHQHLHIQFWKIKINEMIENGISQYDLKIYPFPIVIHNFIEKM